MCADLEGLWLGDWPSPRDVIPWGDSGWPFGGAPFHRALGLLSSREAAGELVRCALVGSWGRVGRKCLSCQWLFSNRI